MNFKMMIDKFQELKRKRDENSDLKPEVDDKVLISLQRQRQIQINEMEKKRLKSEIKDYNMKKNRRDFWGYKNDIVPKQILYGKKTKCTLLNDDKPLLKQRNPKVGYMFK